MELVAQYQKIHEKKDPWIEAFLKEEPMPAYQRKLIEALGSGKRPVFRSGHGGNPCFNPYFRMARRSGKTAAQMEMLEQALESPDWRRQIPEPVHAIRISPELEEHMRHSVFFTDTMNQLSRQVAQFMERRIYNQIMYGIDKELITNIEFENGSNIRAMPSNNTIRAAREPFRVMDIEEFRRTFELPDPPPEFQQEYLCRWVGDTDGNVPSIHDD